MIELRIRGLVIGEPLAPQVCDTRIAEELQRAAITRTIKRELAMLLTPIWSSNANFFRAAFSLSFGTAVSIHYY